MHRQFSHEIQISLLLGSSGLLLSWFLSQSLSMALWWMPILMVILSVGSIGCLALGLLATLRGRQRLLQSLLRFVSLGLGLFFLWLLVLLKTQPRIVSLELLSFLLSTPFLFLGLWLDLWLMQMMRVSRWKIYRYAVKSWCVTIGLLSVISLIVYVPDFYQENPAPLLEIIRNAGGLITGVTIAYFASDKYLCDR
jgi:hypothetical protein